MDRNQKRIVIIHTRYQMTDMFSELCHAHLVGVDVLTIIDEPLVNILFEHGILHQEVIGRLRDHIHMAQNVHARAVLVTCSSLSPAVDVVRTDQSSPMPILKIDEAMATNAVLHANHLGLIATVESTIGASKQLLKEKARERGRNIDLVVKFVDKALACFLAGDFAGHDQLVMEAIHSMPQRVDGIVLAQASTARVLGAIPLPSAPPHIFSCPYSAVQEIKKILNTEKHHNRK